MMPPTHMIGAITMSVNVISASIWTCWMSLVFLVISDGVPKLADLARREVMYPLEDREPQIAADRHRRPRPEVHRAGRADDLDQRDQQHEAADLDRCNGCRR